MRVVTWNCNGALRRKFPELARMNADVLIVQECENPAVSSHPAYRDWAGDGYLWIGDNAAKGLGVFPRNGQIAKAIPRPPDPSRYFLPFLLGNVPVCAVWAHRDLIGSGHYIGQVWNFLQTGPAWLSDPKCILAGDFNSSAIWDRQRKTWNHSAMVDALARQGLRSAYHEAWAELQGEESRPTFFLHRNRMKPYHIDYAFIGSGWKTDAVTVGSADTWLAVSDHVPLATDLSGRAS